MALYSTSNLNATTPAQTNMTTSFKSVTGLAAQTTGLRRAFIFEFDVGASAVPNATDCEIVWDLSAQTAAGTPVVLTVTSLDQADAATGTIAGGNHTAEPTVTANSSRFALAANQRASYRWVVAPGGPGEIVIPATNLAGYVIRAKSSTYASTVISTILFRE
jgi:hypothetical protein